MTLTHLLAAKAGSYLRPIMGTYPGDEKTLAHRPRRHSLGSAAALTLVTVLGMHASMTAPPVVNRKTDHLTLSASLSSDTVSRGDRLSLIVRIVPRKGMHLYAPGTRYRAATVRLNPHPGLKFAQPVYPQPTVYVFKPLNEEVFVYSTPFDVSVRVAVTTPRPGASQLRVSGALDYQACDDRVCYLPETVPFSLPVTVSAPPTAATVPATS